MGTDCNHDAPHNVACSKCGMWLMDDGWIACSDRKPKPGSWVLVWGLPGSPPVGSMLYDLNRKWQWAETGEILSDALRITHWRPLPAPPHPGREEKQT